VLSHFDGLILSAHAFYCEGVLADLHFGLDMERRLHEVYERKKDIPAISYIERFSFIIGDLRSCGCLLGIGWARSLSILLLCLEYWVGGQGVGLNTW
jgi:hypothetical protein